MKRIILITVFLLVTINLRAQFYVSVTGGVARGTEKKVLGQETTLTSLGELSIKDLKGSYGQGGQTQIRGGYLFNKKIGVELGVGYLHGFDQDVNITEGIPMAPEVNIHARARAFGASLSGVYHFSENFYARVGALTKIGGKTEAIGNINMAATGTNLDFITDFHGELPFGVAGAIGFKQPMTENVTFFIEVEYLSINVTRDISNLSEVSGTFLGNTVNSSSDFFAIYDQLSSDQTAAFGELPFSLRDEFVWGEEGTEKPDAPYSSVGINFGITYTFN